MANREQLELIRESVKKWNTFRHENRSLLPDLNGANLSRANLRNADLNGANLNGANLFRADLSGATFIEAGLIGADLREANLSMAFLHSAKLKGAMLGGAKLREASLPRANLIDVDLRETDLTDASLREADLQGCSCHRTTFAGVALAVVNGLADIRHIGPSTIGTDTLALSKGQIPDVFLRGCGLSDWEIEAAKLHNPSLRRDQRTNILYEMDRILNDQPIKYESLFISYSIVDEEFATKLHADFQKAGVRCWFAPHDMKSGRPIYEQVDNAIHMQDRSLLLLSKASMDSKWVRLELTKARGREIEENIRHVFPLGLADIGTIKRWELINTDTGEDLAAEVRKYFIPDFSNWKNSRAYKAAFDKLLEALKPG